jgi:hypothetical protein
MNIEFKIKDGKDTTTYNVDLAPTEETIKKITGNITSILKTFVPNVTKTTTKEEDLTHKKE